MPCLGGLDVRRKICKERNERVDFGSGEIACHDCRNKHRCSAHDPVALVLSKHKVERIGQILGSGLTTVEDSTAALLLAATEAYTSNNVCTMSSCA